MDKRSYIIVVMLFILLSGTGLGWWIYERSFEGFFEEGAVEGTRRYDGAEYEVYINTGPETPMVETGLESYAGMEVPVSCSTCHTTLEPELGTRSTEDLTEFHQGMEYDHGELSCLSCHNDGNYDRLRVADGRQLNFENTRQLCAQCHGPQSRDYENGSHGGMMGYWDLSQGPRHRNTCTDCHDAHAPAYPEFDPVFPPRDRFSATHDEH